MSKSTYAGYGHIYRREDGVFRYEYQKSTQSGGLTPRMKLLAELSSLGLKDKEILHYMKIKKTAIYTGFTCISRKDVRVTEHRERNIEEIVAKAKDIIMSATTQAAQNYKTAVDQGDLKASGKVLDLCGGFTQSKDVNVNVSFGKWLKSVQNKRGDMDDLHNGVIDVTPAPKELENKNSGIASDNSKNLKDSGIGNKAMGISDSSKNPQGSGIGNMNNEDPLDTRIVDVSWSRNKEVINPKIVALPSMPERNPDACRLSIGDDQC